MESCECYRTRHFLPSQQQRQPFHRMRLLDLGSLLVYTSCPLLHMHFSGQLQHPLGWLVTQIWQPVLNVTSQGDADGSPKHYQLKEILNCHTSSYLLQPPSHLKLLPQIYSVTPRLILVTKHHHWMLAFHSRKYYHSWKCLAKPRRSFWQDVRGYSASTGST